MAAIWQLCQIMAWATGQRSAAETSLTGPVAPVLRRAAGPRPMQDGYVAYVNPSGEFNRDQRYIPTRITADGRDGYPVKPGRYRLVVARA
ncbi:MAG TPA: hypothetical protein VN238_00165, partial [Solirubrobacteraceae bacterium]|nr:hypothetical protein [Solirubrobacteraceae bacterium]